MDTSIMEVISNNLFIPLSIGTVLIFISILFAREDGKAKYHRIVSIFMGFTMILWMVYVGINMLLIVKG